MTQQVSSLGNLTNTFPVFNSPASSVSELSSLEPLLGFMQQLLLLILLHKFVSDKTNARSCNLSILLNLSLMFILQNRDHNFSEREVQLNNLEKPSLQSLVTFFKSITTSMRLKDLSGLFELLLNKDFQILKFYSFRLRLLELSKSINVVCSKDQLNKKNHYE